MGIQKRHSFNKIVRVGGSLEYDYLSSKLNEFEFEKYSTFRIPYVVENRPDLVSQRVYGTPDLWWLLLLANDIIDPFEEFTGGRQIIVPSLEEYYDFYNRKVRMNRDIETNAL